MKVTMKDIAKRANVSITTVSLVLNNKPGRVSEELRNEILSIADEMNYIPNYSAKQLVTNKSNTVGIIVPDLKNYFFSGLVSQFQEIMNGLGYFVLIATSNDCAQQDIEALNKLVSRGVEMVAIVAANGTVLDYDAYLENLKNIHVPVLLLDRSLPNYEGPLVKFDDRGGMRSLTRYVLENQHEKIAFVRGNQSIDRVDGRTEGFLLAMEDAGYTNTDIYLGDYSYQSGYNLFDKIIADKDYSAIIAANDMMAFGLIYRAMELDYSIPQDISICGYDNVIFSEMIYPQLTTVNQDLTEMFLEIEKVSKKLLNQNYEIENIYIDTKLIVRDSVRRL